MALAEILTTVKKLKTNEQLIVITGGEPLRQPIAPLCETLIAEQFKVQIETNGTLWRELPEAVEIVCSPKNNGAGYFPLRPNLLARVNAFKFIISAQIPEYSDVMDVGQGSAPVFVQPMDEYDVDKNAANLALATTLAQRHGYRLSLQLHKIAGIE
jgi:organic radical activating enzyme